MGFKKFLGKVSDKIEDTVDNIKESREESRLEKEREIQAREERHQELEEIRNEIETLLDKFTIKQLDTLCREMIGRTPDDEIVRKDDDDDEYDEDEYEDEDEDEDQDEDEDEDEPLRRKKKNRSRFDRRQSLKSDRSTYIDFIWDKLTINDLKFSQIEDFALKKKIVSPSFFNSEIDGDKDLREFIFIMHEIEKGFEPEQIKDEKELQSQLTIFLKAKFSDKKIEREVTTKSGDKLDIVIDGKFVLELKVPRGKTDLRNLSAQLEEYHEEYPNICAIIADISKIVDLDDPDPVEENLTQRISEYADKYKMKLDIPTLTFNVIKRK